MAKRRGLGRGLDALLSGTGHDNDASGSDAGELRHLPVDLVERGRYQPRGHFDPAALEALTESVRMQGVVQPVVVRPLAGGARFELVAGERRWRAAQAAGLARIPALVRDIPDEAVLAIALIENIQREDLNPLEEARALKRLIEEFEMTHQEAASAIGRSRAAVSNALRLLELAPDVAIMLDDGRLEMGHARALLGLTAALQRSTAQEVVARDLTARETEALVRRLKSPPPQRAGVEGQDPDVRRLQERLSRRLGTTVTIVQKAAGKGRINIAYNSLEELDGILEQLRLAGEDDG